MVVGRGGGGEQNDEVGNFTFGCSKSTQHVKNFLGTDTSLCQNGDLTEAPTFQISLRVSTLSVLPWEAPMLSHRKFSEKLGEPLRMADGFKLISLRCRQFHI